MIHTINLKAGQAKQIGRGRYVRLLEAQGIVNIVTQTIGDKANQNGELIENVGAEFYKFESAQLLSDIDQKIVVAIWELPIFDNRVGNNSSAALITKEVGATRSYIYERNAYRDAQTAKANNDNQPQWLFFTVKERIKSVVYFPEPVFIFSDIGGIKFPLPAGYFEYEAIGGMRVEKQDKSNANAMKFVVLESVRD